MCKYCREDGNAEELECTRGTWARVVPVSYGLSWIAFEGESGESSGRFFIRYCPWCGRALGEPSGI